VLRHDRSARRGGRRRAPRHERRRQSPALRDRGAEQYRIQTAIEDAGYELGAIYHSHTRSAPEPSQTDINLAFYPDALYVIVGVAGDHDDVRAWNIVDGKVTEAALEVEEG
jgi:proteasome lid subunit RPN8/RPN11